MDGLQRAAFWKPSSTLKPSKQDPKLKPLVRAGIKGQNQSSALRLPAKNVYSPGRFAEPTAGGTPVSISNKTIPKLYTSQPKTPSKEAQKRKSLLLGGYQIHKTLKPPSTTPQAEKTRFGFQRLFSSCISESR